jgi:hypothetical protein
MGILGTTNYLSEEMLYATEWLGAFPFKRVVVNSSGGLAAPLQLSVQEGSLFLHRFVVRDVQLNSWDLTDYIVRMKIRADDYAGAVQADLSEGEGTTTGNAGVINYLDAGYFDVLMDAVATAAFAWDAAVYDIFLVQVAAVELAHGGGFTSLNVDIDDGTGKGKITADGGTPFNAGVVSVGNLIRLTDAEDAKNNGVYTVQARTDTVLTFEKVIGLGYGTDNAADTAMKVYVLTPAEANAIKLTSGAVTLSRAVSQ